MEIPWMEMWYHEPKIQKNYWVTVDNKLWDEPKAMMLYWGEEVYKGIKRGAWMLNNSKIPSTWEVTHWMELPKAVRRD